MIREMSKEHPPEPLDFFIWTVEVTNFQSLFLFFCPCFWIFLIQSSRSCVLVLENCCLGHLILTLHFFVNLLLAHTSVSLRVRLCIYVCLYVLTF